jgi:hypothetical protein
VEERIGSDLLITSPPVLARPVGTQQGNRITPS